MENSFSSIHDITMNNLKENYLNILQSMSEETWSSLYENIIDNREKKFKGNVLLTTAGTVTVSGTSTVANAVTIAAFTKAVQCHDQPS